MKRVLRGVGILCVILSVALEAVVAQSTVGPTSTSAPHEISLRVIPISPRPGVTTGVAELLTDIVLSECTEIPGVTVSRSERESDAERGHEDLVLELSVWNVDDNYEMITTLHDAQRRTVIDSRFVTIDATNMTRVIEAWRDDLQVVLRRLSDQRIVGHIEYLYAQENWDRAWEYFLQADVVGIPVDPAIPQAIRQLTADQMRETLTQGRRPPADADAILRDALVWSPVAFTTAPVVDRIRDNRVEITEERFSTLEDATQDLVRTGEYESARNLLREDTYQDLWIYTPQGMHSLDRSILQRQEDAYISLAQSDLRRMDESAAQRHLAGAASLQMEDPARLIDALETYEETVSRRRSRAIRHGSRPQPASPRTVRDREIAVGVHGYGTNDPEVRYDNESVELAITGGYSVVTPIVPYLRLSRSLNAALIRQGRTTRGDLYISAGPTVGTELAELTIGASAGLSALTGSREIVGGDDTEEKQILQGGPSISLDLGVAGNITNKLGLALDIRWIGTLWIPDLYVTPSTSVGISCRYRL